MALTHSVLVCLAIDLVLESNAASLNASSEKAVLNIKRRSEVVDEAFLEQKDVLLDMLENKLQEVREKKKKRSDHSDKDHYSESSKCGTFPNNVDLKLKANGISAVGDADVRLKFGILGTNALKFDASGISNVGKAHVDLDAGDGSIYLPGFGNIFRAKSAYDNCTSIKQNEGIEMNLIDSKSDYLENMRRGVQNGTNEVINLDTTNEPNNSTTVSVALNDVNALNVTVTVSTSASNVTQASSSPPK